MAPKFLPLLFIFYLSSSLFSPGFAVCVSHSGPYNSLLRDYLPPPKSVGSSHTSDPHAASPSPSTSPPTGSSSPQPVKPPPSSSSSTPESVVFSDTSGYHTSDSHAASPSTRSSSPQSVKPPHLSSSSTPESVVFSDTSGYHTSDSHAASPSLSTSPSTRSLSPQSVKPPHLSSSSTPESVVFSDTSGYHTSDSHAASPSPSASPVKPPPSSSSSTPESVIFSDTSGSHTSESHSASPSPSTSPSSSSSSPSSMVEVVVSATADAASSAAKATSNAASSVAKAATKAIKSKMTNSDKLINVLDGSLKAICDKLPFPDLCMAELPSAAEDGIKAIDLNGALGLAIMNLLNEARATRDKARTLVTNDFVYDPINLCNRTMGGALSDSKDALASYGLEDWGSVKSNFDSYVHRLGVCTERKPQGLMAEMEKMGKLWQNANAVLCTIDPTLKAAR